MKVKLTIGHRNIQGMALIYDEKLSQQNMVLKAEMK